MKPKQQTLADTATILAAQEYAKNVRGLNHKKTAAVDFIQGARYAAERYRWHDATVELPPEGMTVAARKRGRWTNLCICNGGKWHCGNPFREWKPDEWMYLPE